MLGLTRAQDRRFCKRKTSKQKRRRIHKPTMADFPIPPTKVHKDKKRKSRAKEKESLAKELKQVLREDG